MRRLGCEKRRLEIFDEPYNASRVNIESHSTTDFRYMVRYVTRRRVGADHNPEICNKNVVVLTSSYSLRNSPHP